MLLGMLNVHLFVPADVNVIPVAVGVFALYPVFGLQVIVIVVPGDALAALVVAVPPVPAFTVTLCESTYVYSIARLTVTLL